MSGTDWRPIDPATEWESDRAAAWSEEVAAMTHPLPSEPDLAALREAAADIRERHNPNNYDQCAADHEMWPCAAELLAELVLTVAALRALDRPDVGLREALRTMPVYHFNGANHVRLDEVIAALAAAHPQDPPEREKELDVELLRDAMYDADQRCSGIPGECCAPPTHADAAAIAIEYNRLVAKGARR